MADFRRRSCGNRHWKDAANRAASDAGTETSEGEMSDTSSRSTRRDAASADAAVTPAPAEGSGIKVLEHGPPEAAMRHDSHAAAETRRQFTAWG
jgi:hypothetical protein